MERDRENGGYIRDPQALYAGQVQYEADIADEEWLRAQARATYAGKVDERSRTGAAGEASVEDLEDLFTQWEFYQTLTPVRPPFALPFLG